MDITFARCEQILDTLPIGYYAGRRVRVALQDDIPTSYYSPTEDQITISYPIIREGVSKVIDETDIETTIRSMMYHEVSHAILTPTRLEMREEQKDVVNIFEDERIETILRDYYYGVNFRQQVYVLNNGIHDPKNATDAFYNAVRFGLAPKKILDDINHLISKYGKMTRNVSRYDSWSYVYDIWNLYKRIAEEYKYNSEPFKPQGGEEGESSKPSGFSVENGDQLNETQVSFAEVQRDLQNTLEEVEALLSQGMDIEARLKQGQIEDLHDLQKTAEIIISNFNKKNSGGSGINTYSGVFNPRAVARKDYRYFERASTIQGNNRFGTCHLNLFIDCSGSFCDSEGIVNGMLVALSEIERKNRNFSMDVVFCGEGVYKCKNMKERQIECDGGNNLPDDMKEVFLSLQKPNTCNYNIVLFDGDAFSDYYGSNKIKRCTEIFGAFDYKQTTLITDQDNVRYLGDGFNSAKVIVTKNYTNELLKNITNALTIAFN